MSPPGDRREPPADTKCPPAAQRKQARSALVSTKTPELEFLTLVKEYLFSHQFGLRVEFPQKNRFRCKTKNNIC